MSDEILDETEVALMSGCKLDAQLSRELATSHEALRAKLAAIEKERAYDKHLLQQYMIGIKAERDRVGERDSKAIEACDQIAALRARCGELEAAVEIASQFISYATGSKASQVYKFSQLCSLYDEQLEKITAELEKERDGLREMAKAAQYRYELVETENNKLRQVNARLRQVIESRKCDGLREVGKRLLCELDAELRRLAMIEALEWAVKETDAHAADFDKSIKMLEAAPVEHFINGETTRRNIIASEASLFMECDCLKRAFNSAIQRLKDGKELTDAE